MKRTHFIFEIFSDVEDFIEIADWDGDYVEPGVAENYLRSLAELDLKPRLRVEIWNEPPADFMNRHKKGD